MNLKRIIINLTGASALAFTAATLVAQPAAAEINTGGGGKPTIYCALTGDTLDPPSGYDYEFFEPGESAIVRQPNGQRVMLTCGNDGHWRAARRAPQGGPLLPRPTGGVYAPAYP